MTLLSNVYKWPNKEEQPKKITIRQFVQHTDDEIKEEVNQEQASLILNEAQNKLKDAELQAKKILDRANAQIEESKQQWEQEKQTLFEQVKQQAYNIGFEEGKTAALQAYDQYLEEAKNIIELAKDERDQLIAQHDEIILNIAIRVAEKIVTNTLEESGEHFRSLVNQAISDAKGMPKVELHLHPLDFEEILESKEELQYIIGQHSELTLYPSKELERYSCIIETPYGQIDASVDTQFKEIKTKLMEFVEEEKRSEGRANHSMD